MYELARISLHNSLKQNGYYSYTYEDVEIRLSRAEQFYELVLNDVNTIGGYTKKRDIRESDVVIDAGAYPGEFTIYAAKKAEKVLALEPDPENAEKLRQNLDLNNVKNVDVLEKGLWDEDGQVSFLERQEGSTIKEGGSTEISTTTLDAIQEKRGEEIDFIKMDIEGAEIEALEGGREVMKETEPFFAIASYHEVDGKPTWRKLEEIFRENGYEVKTGHSEHKTTWGWTN